jgi:hypothetical protein
MCDWMKCVIGCQNFNFSFIFKKNPVCDDIPVYGTDYDKIVLVEVKFAHRFINNISSPKVSLATYSNNKDE